jgi:response regulator NasT
LAEILEQAHVNKITTVSTAGEARRLLIKTDYDLCIVNTPLPDEFGESLALNIATKGLSEVILLVRAEIFDEISDKVEDFGVITIAKPISHLQLWNALKISQVAHKKMQIVQAGNERLVQRIDDIRIVDRAKCILVSYLSMTEPEAHKYIEKQAMNMRIKKRAVAEEILKTYEN